MTTDLVKLASNDGQIIKSELLDGRRVKFLPSVAECAYCWLRIDGYLGNVSLSWTHVTSVRRDSVNTNGKGPTNRPLIFHRKDLLRLKSIPNRICYVPVDIGTKIDMHPFVNNYIESLM